MAAFIECLNLAREKDVLTMECFVAFLRSHSWRQSYHTLYYLRKFIPIFVAMDRNMTFQFCVEIVKSVRFFPAFVTVADVLKRVGDGEFAVIVGESLAAIVESDSRKKAFAAIVNGKVTREALDLASVEGNAIAIRRVSDVA
jgi:hypothetical protein